MPRAVPRPRHRRRRLRRRPARQLDDPGPHRRPRRRLRRVRLRRRAAPSATRSPPPRPCAQGADHRPRPGRARQRRQPVSPTGSERGCREGRAAGRRRTRSDPSHAPRRAPVRRRRTAAPLAPASRALRSCAGGTAARRGRRHTGAGSGRLRRVHAQRGLADHQGRGHHRRRPRHRRRRQPPRPGRHRCWPARTWSASAPERGDRAWARHGTAMAGIIAGHGHGPAAPTASWASRPRPRSCRCG